VFLFLKFRSARAGRECAHLPSDVELIVADKVGVITLERVENKRLVRLWDLVVGEPPLIRQVHFGRHRVRVQARHLCVHLQVNRLGGLDADDELVARDVFEDTLSDVLELDTNFHLGFVQGCPKTFELRMTSVLGDRTTFSGLEDEGHAFPTGIVDPERRRGESGARGVPRHGIVIEVTRLPVRGHVLSEERVLSRDRRDCAENFHLMQMTTSV
jgi:hypothetical protein